MDKNYIILSRIIILLHPDVQIECQDVPNAGCYIVTMTMTKKSKNERFSSFATFVSNID